ncbi:hypothetical protein [Tateyamaria sp.]|uniref:hypothetical protein n=1 Tax=Tateyamaria sp. TaxID=1929288 RepID=UPI00329B6B59
MNYRTTLTAALVAATVSAGALGLSTYLYLENIHVDWWLAGMIAAVIAFLFGLVWHILLHATDTVRHGKGMVTMILVGIFLVAAALPITGRGMATLLGGENALRTAQTVNLSEFDAALSEAYVQVQDQEGVLTAILQAEAQTGALAQQEATSGQGPRFRDLIAAQRMYDQGAQTVGEELARGAAFYEDGADALARARANVGNEVAFDNAIADVQLAIRNLNGINVVPDAKQIGVVVTSQGGALPKLDDVSRQLHRSVEAFEPTPVTVPVYAPITAAGEVASVGDNLSYWSTAAFIDVLPFVLMIMLMVFWNETGLRHAPAPRREKSSEEQRIERENVIGLPQAAE